MKAMLLVAHFKKGVWNYSHWRIQGKTTSLSYQLSCHGWSATQMCSSCTFHTFCS